MIEEKNYNQIRKDFETFAFEKKIKIINNTEFGSYFFKRKNNRFPSTKGNVKFTHYSDGIECLIKFQRINFFLTLILLYTTTLPAFYVILVNKSFILATFKEQILFISGIIVFFIFPFIRLKLEENSFINDFKKIYDSFYEYRLKT